MSKSSVYHKQVPTTTVDVYRVLVAFGVTDPCIAHAIKKLLVPGARLGGKTVAQDIAEAIWSLQRWQQMREEEASTTPGTGGGAPIDHQFQEHPSGADRCRWVYANSVLCGRPRGEHG